MRFNIIGAGRLGKNLALALTDQGGHQLVAVCNRVHQTAVAAVDELGSGKAVLTPSDLPAADITFITTPDDCIARIATTWTSASGVIVHCSGALSADVLAPLKIQGCLTASIHPLKAFRKSNLQAHAFQDCDCVVEGDAQAVSVLTTLFTRMGAQVIRIEADKKSTYHAAAVMASNYVVTLAASAVELLIASGLSEQQAKGMAQRLMQSSLTNIQDAMHIADALTGPLARGDLKTVHQHLQAIKSPLIDALYRAAGLATLPLTHLDEKALDALRTCLNEQ